MIKNNKKFMILACLVLFLSLDQCLGLWARSLDSLQDGTEVAFFSLINQDNPNFQYVNNNYTRDDTYYGNILFGPDSGCPYTQTRWILQKQSDGSFIIKTPNADAAPFFYLLNESQNRITVSDLSGVQGTQWVFELISEGIFAMRSLGAYFPPDDSVYAEGRTNGIIGSSPNGGLSNPGTLWKIRLLTPLPPLLTGIIPVDPNAPRSPQKN